MSLVSLIRDRKPLADRSLYWHYPHYSNQLGRPGGAVRHGNYKLVELYEDNRLELYDLSKDIGEKKDLSKRDAGEDASTPCLTQGMAASVKAQMPRPNPDYDPKREDYGYWWRLGTTPK